MKTVKQAEAQPGMVVWAIAEGHPYQCIIQQLGQRSDSHKCMLRFVQMQDPPVPQYARIGWRRYDQLLAYTGEALTSEELAYLLQKAQEPEPLTPREQVKAEARKLGFDFLYNPEHDRDYFVLCCPAIDEVRMFACVDGAYEHAIEWLNNLMGENAEPVPTRDY